jgi:mRNA-degrading endonuclease toxin of MazEF toxin-antitoxin module
VIAVSQIAAIGRQRLIEKITKIDRAVIEQIENNILFILGIKKV